MEQDEEFSGCKYEVIVHVNDTTINIWQTDDVFMANEWFKRFDELIHNMQMCGHFDIKRYNVRLFNNETGREECSLNRETFIVGSKRNIFRYLKAKLKHQL